MLFSHDFILKYIHVDIDFMSARFTTNDGPTICNDANGSFSLLQAHAKYGNQWALIAKLPGMEGR